jgi:hypothetical protein
MGPLQSQLTYFFATTAGESPFIFDGYYQGSKNLLLTNIVKLTDFLAVGAQQNLNLNRENAQSLLAVGNTFFASMGPKDVKFQIAYDFVLKRSFFGINLYPGHGDTPIDFQKMKVYQPEYYTQQRGSLTP